MSSGLQSEQGDSSKFEFTKVSSTFGDAGVVESNQSESLPASDAEAQRTSAAPAESIPTNKETDEERKERLLGDLKKASARAKRFGQDSTEIDKLIERAEKFGADVLLNNSTVEKLDKPLAEKKRIPSHSTRFRGNRNRQSSNRITKPQPSPASAASATARPRLSEEEKEKLRKRQERFTAH
ncbi:hypothetical protein V1511DRAFT_498771 [Dipodascopsis uninucleata]